MLAKHKELFDAINRDETLLGWARGSIRYNDLRDQQARDFMLKLTANRRPIPGVTAAAVKAALGAIERADTE